jgi:hypothetical protein
VQEDDGAAVARSLVDVVHATVIGVEPARLVRPQPAEGPVHGVPPIVVSAHGDLAAMVRQVPAAEEAVDLPSLGDLRELLDRGVGGLP